MTQIAQALTRLFGHHRIILRYDGTRELRQEFDAMELPGVDKVVLDDESVWS